MTAPVRSKPVVLVVFSVPLFVEAFAAASESLADVKALPADDADLPGLIDALRPDAIVVQQAARPSFEAEVPVFHVDLDNRIVSARTEGEWRPVQVDLSAEAIRNQVLSATTVGAGAA